MKIVIFLIILFLNLILIQAPPPFNEFDLKYEYYSINNFELNEMKLYMKEELREQLFNNAYKAIEYARSILVHPNPIEPLYYINPSFVYLQNIVGYFNFTLYHPTQYNQIQQLNDHQPFINQTLPPQFDNEYEEMEYDENAPIEFDQDLTLNGNGTIYIFYFIKYLRGTNIEQLAYSENHTIIPNKRIICLEQSILHRSVDENIIRIFQNRTQPYNINN
ncbi:hypothetical protein ACQ4LE_005359 [Meloidogyne hapla]|uniref:Uncharacterized protein n=1 Tax=Meloidogyne hapla TaxID=6305 RepID=A0A1I8B0Q9_MELHA